MGGNPGRKVKSARSTSRSAKPVNRPAVRNRKDRENYFTQAIDGIEVVGVGPNGKDFEDARVRIRAGEDLDKVINWLVGKVLKAEVRVWEQRLQDLTERLKDLTDET